MPLKMQWSRQRRSRPHKQDDPYLNQYNDGKGSSMLQQRIGRLIHGDDSFYWQDSVSDDPSSVSLNKLHTTDRVPSSVGSTSTPVTTVQQLVKKFEKSNSFPVRQTKWGTSATTSTTSTASASTCRYGMSTRAQASQTRYDVPDSCYSAEPDHNLSRASTLSTRAEQLTFDDFSRGDLLPEFIETTGQLHQQHQPQLRQSIPSLPKRPKNGFLSRFQRRQKKHQYGDQPTPRKSTRQISLDTRTYEYPSDCFPPNDRGCAIAFYDRPNKMKKTKSIMKRPNSRAPGRVNAPGSNNHHYFSAPSSSRPPLPPTSTTSQYQHQDETINEPRLVSLQALFKELKHHHHHHQYSESKTSSSSTRRWGYAHQVDARGGGLASIRAAENENETFYEPQADSTMVKYDRKSSRTISTTKCRRPRESTLRLEHSFSSLNDEEEHEIVFVSHVEDDDEGQLDRKHEHIKSQQRDDIDAIQEILTDYATRDSTSGTREHILAIVDEEEEEIVFEADQDEESENFGVMALIEEQAYGCGESSLPVVAAIPSGASTCSRGGGSSSFKIMSTSVHDVHDEDTSKTGIEMVLEDIYPPRPGRHRYSVRDSGSLPRADQSVVVHVSLSEETVDASPTSTECQRNKQEKDISETKCSIETIVSSVSKLPTADDSPTLRTENPCNEKGQSIQCATNIPPVDGDWSYSTELSHKSSSESLIERAKKERSSVHSRANATVSMDAMFSRATDLLIFRTHDFFFPRSKSLKVKPSQRRESEIHSMCQKLSNLVYPHESSVVAQASIPSSIPTKIGLSLEQHEWRFVIRSIEKESPFFKSPLKAGQTLLSINGIPVNCFESVGEVVEFLCSREWSSDDGDGNNPNNSILSIVATRSIYSSVIKPTADTLVGLGFAMNQHTGTLKIHYVDQHGLFGLKGCLLGGLKVLRLNGKPCPRTRAALNGMLKSCVGPFTIVALPDDDAP